MQYFLIVVSFPLIVAQIDECRLTQSLHDVDLAKAYDEFKQKPMICNPPFRNYLAQPLVRQQDRNQLIIDNFFVHQQQIDNVTCCFVPAQKGWPSFNNCSNDFIGPDKEIIAVRCQGLRQQIPVARSDLFFTIQTGKVEHKMSDTLGDQRPSVLVVGMDGVSRQRLHDQMPKTVEFLKNRMRSVEMEGFHALDKQMHGSVHILTGFSTSQLKTDCISERNGIEFYDSCPFLWRNFNELNYITAYGEDFTNKGLFLGYPIAFDSPIDVDYNFQKFDRILSNHLGYSARPGGPVTCTESSWRIRRLLKNIEYFQETFKYEKTFGYFLLRSLTQDSPALPLTTDEVILQFLQKLQSTLSNTIFIFMSNLGKGSKTETYETMLEEKTPFLFISLPYRMQEKLPQLQSNADKLVTGLDLHQTLYELLVEPKLDEDEDENPNQSEGLSLLKSIPEDRTCVKLRISSETCYCSWVHKLQYRTGLPEEIAEEAIESINAKMGVHSQHVALDGIQDMEELLGTGSGAIKDVIVKFKVKPTKDIYEVRSKIKSGKVSQSYYLEKIGSQRSGGLSIQKPSDEDSDRSMKYINQPFSRRMLPIYSRKYDPSGDRSIRRGQELGRRHLSSIIGGFKNVGSIIPGRY